MTAQKNVDSKKNKEEFNSYFSLSKLFTRMSGTALSMWFQRRAEQGHLDPRPFVDGSCLLLTSKSVNKFARVVLQLLVQYRIFVCICYCSISMDKSR